ncbi:MAG: outer membrane protein assembly factor BamB family protein [Pseudonocardia sp.]
MGRERWRARLPSRECNGVVVAGDGTCFVVSRDAITALDGPEIRWSVGTETSVDCLVLTGGLLVTWERTGNVGGLVVRDRQEGAVVSRIDAMLSSPAVIPTGLLVFCGPHGQAPTLRATTLSGQLRWEHRLHEWEPYPPLVRSDHLVIANRCGLRAFDLDGNPLWTADRRGFGPGDAVGEPGQIVGPLVGLPDGRILAAIRPHDLIGYLVVDPQQHSTHVLPEHLPNGGPIVPLGRELVVMRGNSEKREDGRFYPVVVAINPTTGEIVVHHPVPTAPDSMVAGTNGLVAIAGSPTTDRWDKYHGWPGYDLRDDCYVRFLDESGVRSEWRPEQPVTGPLAVGADGDLLVPVSGELCSIE